MIRTSYQRLALLILFFSITHFALGEKVYPGEVDLLGAEETVFDWTADACEQESIPDAPTRAFRDATGSHTEFTIELTVNSDSRGTKENAELLFSLEEDEFCPGAQVKVDFHLKEGVFNSGNELKVFASAPDGDFSEPFLLANITKTDTLGSFFIQIPTDAPFGNQYKLQLSSSDPFLESNEVTDITVFALPQITLADFSDVCENLAPIGLTQGQPAGGIYSGAGVSGELFDPSQVQPGTYKITYAVSSQEGCSAEREGAIKVLAAPEVTFPAFNTLLCENFVPLSLNSARPVGGIYRGLGVENGKFDPAIAGSGNHLIQYTYTEGGCTDSAESAIAVSATPNVYLAPIDIQCESGLPVELQVSPEGGIFEGPGIFNNTFNPGLLNIGSYTIGYEYTNGTCSGLATIDVEVIADPPIPILTVEGEFLKLNRNYEKIEWYLNGVLIEGANGILLQPTQSGNYRVSVFGAGMCRVDSEEILWQKATTSLDEELLKAWRIYPNPTSAEVNLVWDPSLFSFGAEVIFSIYNGVGKLVHIQKAGNAKSKTVLDLSGWPLGIYTVEILSENRRAQRKLVVDGN